MLELYQRESCPFCQPVRQLLTDLQVDYIIRNQPKDRTQRTELISLTDVPYIPALKQGEEVIAGRLEECEHILDYIRKTFS
ncbi:glutaredoxin domain-containing protein [Vibrio rhizosphaerae]|uniref:Glutaredoxin domain-containing protein n=1 Tax=Vibrio rhizosphaerae TaxID=398736 RepID=A0ABU4IRW3_9VIBR|nr:glutaredoxin domain-containing protein [Vibrio rhizosphaerae]MDW6092145.1 glutaredoxin domain-containing protein [Vibrio rhizosphaerae]